MSGPQIQMPQKAKVTYPSLSSTLPSALFFLLGVTIL
jgi:hypothetical protein